MPILRARTEHTDGDVPGLQGASEIEKGSAEMITMSIICIIGCIADKLFSRIGTIERFIDSLPLGREP